mgnify:CR=1 FL=1
MENTEQKHAQHVHWQGTTRLLAAFVEKRNFNQVRQRKSTQDVHRVTGQLPIRHDSDQGKHQVTGKNCYLGSRPGCTPENSL